MKATIPPFSCLAVLCRSLVTSFVLTASMVTAQETPNNDPALSMIEPAGDHALDEYLWLKRPVVIFADSPADPRYGDQIEMLLADPDPLIERDVVVLTDTDPSTPSPLRRTLRPRGFALVLIGKDGAVKLRKPTPWTVRELSRAIDKMPMRREEIRSRRDNPS